MKRSNTVSITGKVALQSRRLLVLLLILSTFIFTTAASAAELVVNGGFEDQPTVVDPDLGWMTYYGENGPPVPTGDCPADNAPDNCNDVDRVLGWSVFWTDDILNYQQLNPGRLEIQTGNVAGAPAYGGSLQKAELDSHHRVGDDNNNVTIAQLLPTCPLTAYTLTYAWHSRTTIENDNDVRVIVGNNPEIMHAQNGDWENETVHFISENSDYAGYTLLLFGSIGNRTTTGMFLDEVSVTGPDGSDAEPCTSVCDDKPMELTLRYSADWDINHNQSGNEVVISPDTDPGYTFPDPATIEVYGHKWKSPELLGTFEEVEIDDFFSVKGPHKRIPPRLTFKIYDGETYDPETPETNELFQTVTFHTSCSQPLEAGDEFGAITVWSAVN